MAIVSPSILSADFGKLGADCRMVLDAGAQMLHYDVMDGHFVPNISFGVPVLKSLHKALPDAFYDVHLMISHPLQYAEPFIKAGATLYNFHLECEDDIQATIDAVRALGCKVGLTIKPGTPAEALAPWLDQLDLVLVMSVEPGFGGQKFMADMMPKVRQIREYIDAMNPGCELEVDGGVDPNKGVDCSGFTRYVLGKAASISLPLLTLAIPLMGNRLVLNILASAEAVWIPSCLQRFGLSSSEAFSVYGVLTGMALPFILFPSAITNSMAVLLLPNVAHAQSEGKHGPD
mgnify:CR=1 FL=1